MGMEPVKEEPKKPYHYRDVTKCPVEEAEQKNKDMTKISEDGFQEFVSRKERRRRKTHSQSEHKDTIALVDEIQSVEQEQENLDKINQGSNLESKDVQQDKVKQEITTTKENK